MAVTSKNFTEQKSGSSTTGGSTSSTQYGSNTHSETNWDQHSRGGSHSTSASKSWASGTVDEAVQAQKQRAEAGYTAGADVQDTKARLQDTLSGKPGPFSSTYQSKLDDLYNQIMGRDKFSYDFNKDEMYRMYKDQYQNTGRNAMRDTMGQAAAMTGGYGSSYAQTAGQQQYQNYLQQLNEIIPELRNQRYQEWLAEGQDLYNKYNLTNQAYNNEYGQYRDTVADWQSDRSFNQAAYESERNFDRSNFDADRAYYQSEFWNQRNAEQSHAAEANEENWNDSWGRSVTDSSTTGWQNTQSSNWSNTNNWSNGSSWTDNYLLDQVMNQAASGGGYRYTAPKAQSSGLLSGVMDSAKNSYQEYLDRLAAEEEERKRRRAATGGGTVNYNMYK